MSKPNEIIVTEAEDQGIDEVYCHWYKCPNCGDKNLVWGDNYCSSCGKKLKWMKAKP